MSLFAIWAILVLGALAGAGYSHYHYRARRDRYYKRLFAGNPAEAVGAEIERGGLPSLVPLLTLVLVALLVPVSAFI